MERDPGDSAARRTPQRASSSTSAEASAVLRFVGSTAANGTRALEPVALQRLLVDLDPQARSLGQVQEAVAQLARDRGDRAGEQLLRGEAVREPGSSRSR